MHHYVIIRTLKTDLRHYHATINATTQYKGTQKVSVKHQSDFKMPLNATELSSLYSRRDSYLEDQEDAGIVCVDCRNCLITGNKISLLAITNESRHTESYVWVNLGHRLVTKDAIADPDSVQVIFNWKNLTNEERNFAFILQSGLVIGQVVGVERLADGVQLSLQLQQCDKKQCYVIYLQQNSSEHFALYLQSSEGNHFYILPSNGKLLIYKNYLKVTNNVFVFRIGTYKCSNPDGCCPFERLMKRY